MQAPRLMEEARVRMAMGSGLPAPAPEYSTAASRCDVVLTRSLAEEAILHASVPHAPVLVRRVEGARQLGQPAEAAEQLEAGWEPHHAGGVCEGRVQHADGGGEEIAPCRNRSKSRATVTAGNRRRIVLYTWNMGPEYSACAHRISTRATVA